MKKKEIFLAILILSLIILLCGCNKTPAKDNHTSNYANTNSQQLSPKTKEIIDISSDAYYDLINEIFDEVTQQNGYYEFQSYDTYRAPYLQAYIAPKDKYSDDVTKAQTTKLIENVLEHLKKYEYKSGGLFKRECAYINIHFYGFDNNGSYHRNGGPFIQINLFDIQNETVEGLIF